MRETRRLCDALVTQWVRPGNPLITQWVTLIDPLIAQWMRSGDPLIAQWVTLSERVNNTMSEIRWPIYHGIS